MALTGNWDASARRRPRGAAARVGVRLRGPGEPVKIPGRAPAMEGASMPEMLKHRNCSGGVRACGLLFRVKGTPVGGGFRPHFDFGSVSSRQFH